MSYVLESYLDTLQEDDLNEFQIGYVGKYSARTADYIRTQMNKDPNQLSFLRMKRGEVLVAAGIASAVLIAMSIKLYKRYITKTGKACRDYTSGSFKYKICSNNVKIAGRQKQIDLLTNKSTQCKDTKDPSKCKAKIQKHIASIKDKIKKLEAKKREYQSITKS